jgi:murein DD-endopeptidase MepM/ murein hydrolase activator NlpD
MPLEWKVKLVTGKISDNLMSSARAAGIEYSVITKLVSLYSHTIDFQRDIRDGDEFKIMYEYQTNYRDSVMKNPRVLYSYLKVRGSKRELYRDSNSEMYYDQAGKSIKKVLLKTPISGARISSRFGPRKHPVLGYSRMHKGLDYAAPKGTPIYAAGDGVIQFVKSSSSGYGKHIKVRHNSTYSTLYGHMSRFASNVKSGTRVKQGQIIGYVGATGLASGPHLHYEVHKDGKQINPTNVDSSIIVPLSGNKLVAFKKDVNKIDTMLAKLGKSEKSSVAMKSDAIGG